MGQALDREGNVLGEATGNTKREVLDRLEQNHPDAEEIRIRRAMGEGDAREPIGKTFAFHTPGPDSKKQIERIREAFSIVERVLKAYCPDSRERAVALTNLEQAAMWAIKAAVVNDPQSVAETR